MSKYFIEVVANNNPLEQMVIKEVTEEILKIFEKGKTACDVHLVKTEKGFNLVISEDSKIVPMIISKRASCADESAEPGETNNFEIFIKCESDEATAKLAAKFHEDLKGLQEYVDSKILLNYTGCDITYVFGRESNYVPEFKFIMEGE